MSLQTSITTIHPITPDKQFRGTYLVSTSTPPSATGSRARSRSPGNAHLFTLDPRSNGAPTMTDGTPMSREDSTNGDGEWSSAVGRASVGGKSGRVIERLMGDVDRLKRELNLSQARVEEEQLRSVSAREALDSLRGTKENLEAICETNRNIITRRDRKIEDLKAELDQERARRIEAETGRNDLTVSMQNLKLDTAKEVTRATEIADRSQTEYETLRKSLQRMKADSDRQLGQMRKELEVVHSDRAQERTKLRQYKENSDKNMMENVKIQETASRALKEFQSYKKLRDEWLGDMAQQLGDGDAANEQLHADMTETLGRMRWVMNIKKDVPSIRQRDEEDPKNSIRKVG